MDQGRRQDISAESFGARLRRLRSAKGISQSEFATALSVSTAAVCSWEQDRSRPKVSRIHAIAALLSYDPKVQHYAIVDEYLRPA